ncbi:MAG TPA: hypothetical protein VI389_06825 [Geobacteraceae bacterium]
MLRRVQGISGIVLTGALLIAVAPGPATAGVNVNINIGPPPIVIPEPPEVVLVPRTGIYFVPGLEFDVFFYNGYWWSPRGDRWYRSRAYNGPWGIVERRYVPAPVVRVPRDYRVRYERERHIPYGQWKKERHHGKEERGERRERGDRREWRERDERGERGEHGDHERGHRRD